MIVHQNSHGRRPQIDFNFNLLPQVPAGSQFSTTLDAVSNAGNIVSFTVTPPSGSPVTYPATGNAASFLTSHASAGSYTYSAYTTDSRGYTSAVVTKTLTAIVDNVIPYIRHTLNTSSSIQNDSVTSFNIFYGTGGPATGSRSYSILNVPTGMTMSKTSGIVDNESLTMTLNSTISGGKVVTIRLTENGLTHDLSVSLSISSPTALGGENEWHYTTTSVKTFVPPQDGNYEIIGIGGGGAGGASSGPTDPMGHSSGGGGGSGTLNIITSITMYANRSYRIVVGSGGAGGFRVAGGNGGTTTVTDMSNSTVIFSASGGIGGGLPTSNGSAAYGGSGGSGGGEGSVNGESAPYYGGDGGKGGNAGARAYAASPGSGSGQGTTMYSTLATKNISIGDGGRSLPPPGLVHPLYSSYPALGIGEGGYGYGAGGGGGSGTCGSNNPGYGGGGAGGIYPSAIAAPKLAAAGERAPGVHMSSVGGNGANGYVRIKLIV